MSRNDQRRKRAKKEKRREEFKQHLRSIRKQEQTQKYKEQEAIVTSSTQVHAASKESKQGFDLGSFRRKEVTQPRASSGITPTFNRAAWGFNNG